MSTDEMQALLASEGVLKVKKLGKEKSKSYKLLFDMLRTPRRVKLFGESRSFLIREYIPPPLRCYKCQKYDHASSTCRLHKNNFVCQRCGGNHQNKIYREGQCISECQLPMKCIHCLQGHEAGSINCPTQISYVEINKLMVYENISRYEAKSRVFSQYARSDAKVITTSIRLEESRKEVEEARKREAESKLELTAMHKKLEQIMTKVDKDSPVSGQREETLDERIQKAVNAAVLQLTEETDAKVERLMKQMTKLNSTIDSLNEKNKSLEEENKKLRKQLKEKSKEKSGKTNLSSHAKRKTEDGKTRATGESRETGYTTDKPPKLPSSPVESNSQPLPQHSKIRFRDSSSQH